jgi:hypothetical protein
LELLKREHPRALAQPLLRLQALWRSEGAVLRWLLPLALLHGLLYLAMVPPWQHYDEPGHFAYAAEIAAGSSGVASPAATRISREIADSLYRNRFYSPGVAPVLLSDQPVRIGENQRVHPPLYYTIAAAPIALLKYQPVDQQLYAARLVSVLFYTLAILAAWRIAVVALPDEPLMQLVIPLLLLLTPTYADLMTAVNSDVLVNFAAMAMLLGCTISIRHGPNPVGLALALLGILVALLAKRTAIPAVIPCALALLWAWRRGPIPLRLSLPVTLLGLAAFSATTFQFGRFDGELRLVPRRWLVELDQSYLRLEPARWMLSLEDWDRSAALYPEVVRVVFESFWMRMSWGSVGLGPVVDLVLPVLVTLCATGLLALIWQHRVDLTLWQRRLIWLFFIAVCTAWVVTVLRIHPLPPPEARIYVPRGRYMFWAMLPHLWLLALGWQGIAPARWRCHSPLVLLGLFAILDIVAWVFSLTTAYYS